MSKLDVMDVNQKHITAKIFAKIEFGWYRNINVQLSLAYKLNLKHLNSRNFIKTKKSLYKRDR